VDLIAAWLLMPVVALAACLGIGLLVERASGARLPGALLLPVGMAGLVVAGQLTTYWDWSAELTVPLCAALAVAGFVLGWSRARDLRPDTWAVASAAGVFAAFAAPVLLSGSATFAGYTILGDTSIHFIGADVVLQRGRDIGGLAPSSYQAAATGYYGSAAYPSGGPVTAGVLASLTAQDVAWVFQPFLALLAALIALALWSLLDSLVAPRPLRAAVAFLAAQPALVYAYALQGSVKEIGTVFAVLLGAALVPWYMRETGTGPGRALPLAVAAAAGVGLVGAAVAVWLGPLLAIVAAVALYRHGRRGARRMAIQAAVFVVLLAIFSFQALAGIGTYVDVAGTVVTTQTEVGNLIGPLNELQMFGVWLSGDYRLAPGSLLTETYLLLGAAMVGCGFGIAWLVRRRAWTLLLLVAVSAFGWAYVTERGSPWADGKALMIFSPVLVLLAGLGATGLHAAGRRIESAALVSVLAIGVLGSNALAYHDVSLAPRDRLAELERIGDDLSGRGPTLYPEFEEFGKHFLRRGAPTGPSEAWTPQGGPGPARPGGVVRFAFGVDLDALPTDYVQGFRTIVLRRGFMSSRPPATWRRRWIGDFYEVWERGEGDVVEHLPLGEPRKPSTEPDCRDVGALARRARASRARLVAAPRPRGRLMSPAALRHPPAWVVDGADPATLRPIGPGEVHGRVAVSEAGSYDVWVEGSFGRGVEVLVDGRVAGEARNALNGRWSAEHVARLRLDAGGHEIVLRRGGGNLAPGNGGTARLLGPVAVTRADPTGQPLRTVDPVGWRSLCGEPLDWIAAVRT
jgi:hypothetical protein